MKPHSHAHDLKLKKVDRLSATRVRLTVEFPEETVKQHEQATAQRYSQVANIPGFRPGKAPLKMIKEKYKEQIRNDVVSHLLEAGLAEAIEQTKLMPVNRPRIELGDKAMTEGTAFEFNAEFEVQPEIELRKYKGVKVKAEQTTANDDEVEKTLTNLRERFAVLEPVEATKLEKGQFAVAEYGFDLIGEPPMKEAGQTFTIEAGAGQILQELDDALLEMSVGESRDVKTKFPDDYHDAKVKGREAQFSLKLVDIKKKILPELNDAFAAQVREGSTLENLSKEIRESIEQSKAEEKKRTQRQQVVEYLVKNNDFEVPSSLVEQQTVSLLQWMQEDMKKRGYPTNQLQSEEIESVKKRAEQMVRSSLLLKEVALKEKIELDESKLEDRVQSIAKEINRSVDETRHFLSGKGMMDRLRDEVLTDQVFEFLLNHAVIEESVSK